MFSVPKFFIRIKIFNKDRIYQGKSLIAENM